MQLALPLTLPPARPLVPVEVCMVLMDRDEDEILGAIESGVLNWAWDISAPGAARREIRVWRDSLLAVLAGERRPDFPWPEVVDQILPRREVRSTELQRWFSCSSTHINHLIHLGVLSATAPREREDGPLSFSRLARESVASFLAGRRV